MEAVHQYVHNLIAMQKSTPIGAIICDSNTKEKVRESLQDFSAIQINYTFENIPDFLTTFLNAIAQKQQLIVINLGSMLDLKILNMFEQLATGQATLVHPTSGEIHTLQMGDSTIMLLLDQHIYDQLPSELLPFTYSL